MRPNDRADEPRYVLTGNGKKLQILDVHRDDSALYSCVVSNANDSSKYHLFLHVLTAPAFQDSREMVDISVLAGENVTMDCTLADGNPKPTVIILALYCEI